MEKTFKTKIDGVPVELKLLKIGQSSPGKINEMTRNLSKEINTGTHQVRVVSIGDKDLTPTKKQKEDIENMVEEHPLELVGDLIESLQDVPHDKKWWKSKTVWVNITAITASVTALIGSPVEIDPEIAATIFPIIMGIVNLFLRGITKEPIAPLKKKNK